MKFRSLDALGAKMGTAFRDQAAQKLEELNNPVEEKKLPAKYGNKPVEREDGKFDSGLEARVYDGLVAAYGEKSVIRQVSMLLCRGKRIRPDFLIIHERHEDGTFRGEFVDAKGYATDAWNAKANHFFDKFRLIIRLITK